MRALPLMVVLALLTAQLGGCAVAARSAPTRNPASVVAVVAQAAPPAEPTMEVAAEALDEARMIERLGLKPTERLASEISSYAAMTGYVLSAIGDGKPAPGRNSALLDQSSLATLPRMASCGDQRPALIMDLDRGKEPFNLADAPTPEPGLAEQLRQIRGRGVAVVWLASLPESTGSSVLTTVKAIGLDPLGIDHTLLLRANETRKQQILNRAGEEWCVLAVAGDSRSDFDEVFDYLRNPDGPVALALEQHIGAGWFVVPPPIR